LMTSSLKLDLPQTNAAQVSDASPFIAVAIDAQGKLYLGDELMDAAALSARLRDKAKKDASLEVQLRADKAVPYGEVAQLIGQVQQAGLSRIAFVAEPNAASSPR